MACGVLLEGGVLEELREVLAVFPEHAASTPEDIMVATLKLLLAQWRKGAEEVMWKRRKDRVSGEEGREGKVGRLGTRSVVGREGVEQVR